MDETIMIEERLNREKEFTTVFSVWDLRASFNKKALSQVNPNLCLGENAIKKKTFGRRLYAEALDTVSKMGQFFQNV